MELLTQNETCTGGGVEPEPEPDGNDTDKKLIELLLCDALNGWKY